MNCVACIPQFNTYRPYQCSKCLFKQFQLLIQIQMQKGVGRNMTFAVCSLQYNKHHVPATVSYLCVPLFLALMN